MKKQDDIEESSGLMKTRIAAAAIFSDVFSVLFRIAASNGSAYRNDKRARGNGNNACGRIL